MEDCTLRACYAVENLFKYNLELSQLHQLNYYIPWLARDPKIFSNLLEMKDF